MDNQVIKKKKVVVKSKPLFESFRLFDFQTYDYTPDVSENSNSSNESASKNKTRRNI